jgi:hypothetical protein
MNRKSAWKTCINAPEFHKIFSDTIGCNWVVKNQALTLALFIVWASFRISSVLWQAGEAAQILFELDFPRLQTPMTDQIRTDGKDLICVLPAFEVCWEKIEPASPETAATARQLARTGAYPKILFWEACGVVGPIPKTDCSAAAHAIQSFQIDKGQHTQCKFFLGHHAFQLHQQFWFVEKQM